MAQYEIQELSLPNEKGERILYPRLVLSGQLNARYLIEHLASGTTYNVGEAMGLITAFTREMAYYLGQGYSVKVDELGIFTATLEFKEGKAPQESGVDATRRNARSIQVKGINFRPDKQFVLLTSRECELVRAKRAFRRSSSKYTPEERLKRALQYLEKNPYMTVLDYASLNDLCRSPATRELRKWAQQPDSGISSVGSASHRIYVRAARVENGSGKMTGVSS